MKVAERSVTSPMVTRFGLLAWLGSGLAPNEFRIAQGVREPQGPVVDTAIYFHPHYQNPLIEAVIADRADGEGN